MTRLKRTIAWSDLSKGGSAFLLVWLGAACGNASPTDENGNDGGPSGAATDDAGDTGLAFSTGSTDGGSTDGATADEPGSTPATILAESGISSVPSCAITGNLGISPAAASFITGFGSIADSTNVFSTSPQVTGKVYAADYTAPTPSNLTTAVSDMQLAFTDAAGRAPNFTERGAGNIGGLTLTPGVYRWSTGVLIPTNVTLTGGATDVWIFQIA